MGIQEMLLEAGVDVLETCAPPPVGDLGLRKAKEMCRGKLTLMGYIDLIPNVLSFPEFIVQIHRLES